jgi:hypothetical protein
MKKQNTFFGGIKKSITFVARCLIEVWECRGVENIFSKKIKKVENKFCGEEKNIYFCDPQMKIADSSLRLKKEYVRRRKRFIFKKD